MWLLKLCLRLSARSSAVAGMLDQRVRPRKHQAGVPIVEFDQVGRITVGPVDLDDHPVPLGVTHDLAVDMKPVPYRCVHSASSSADSLPRYFSVHTRGRVLSRSAHNEA